MNASDPADPLNETPAFDSRFAVSDEAVVAFCSRAMAERRAGVERSEYESKCDDTEPGPAKRTVHA